MLTVGNIVPRGRDGGIGKAYDARYRVVLRRAYDPETQEFDLDRLNGIVRFDEGSPELNAYRDKHLREQVLAAWACELGSETARLWLELGTASCIMGRPDILQLARDFQESLKERFMEADKFGNLVDTRDEELKTVHLFEIRRYLSRLVRQVRVIHTPIWGRNPRKALMARYFLCRRPTSRTRAPRSARRASFSMAASSPGGGDSSGDPDSGDPPEPYLSHPFVAPPSNSNPNQRPLRPWLGLGCCRMERGRSVW